jgi:hypothetical protein
MIGMRRYRYLDAAAHRFACRILQRFPNGSDASQFAWRLAVLLDSHGIAESFQRL